MPGVKIRFWPRASTLLIACASSLGLAMKNSSMGIDVPGVGPPLHVVPMELLLRRGHEDVVVAVRVHVQIGRLAGHRAGGERGVRATARRLCREALGGSAHDTGEHLVPDPVRPAVEVAVPDQPLLLRPVDHSAAVELRVGDEATTGKRRARAIVHQRGQAR